MSTSQIIVLATPVFLLFIAIEFAWGYAKGRNTYRLNDAVNSICLGMLSQISAVFTRLFRVGIYTAIYSHVAIYPNKFHRVHHAVNDRYLDRNYGGILIVWDRLFGSSRKRMKSAFTARASP